MLNALSLITKEFLEQTEKKAIRVITHHDTDGITSAAIITKTLRRLNKPFTLRVIKGIDEKILQEELKRNSKEINFLLQFYLNSMLLNLKTLGHFFLSGYLALSGNLEQKNSQIKNSQTENFYSKKLAY